jgi:hypothetical protein
MCKFRFYVNILKLALYIYLQEINFSFLFDFIINSDLKLDILFFMD